MITVMEVRRRAKNLTQAALAQEVGITQPEVSLIEGGTVPPKAEVRAALAQVLEVDPVHLQLSYDEYLRVVRPIENLQG